MGSFVYVCFCVLFVCVCARQSSPSLHALSHMESIGTGVRTPGASSEGPRVLSLPAAEHYGTSAARNLRQHRRHKVGKQCLTCFQYGYIRTSCV